MKFSLILLAVYLPVTLVYYHLPQPIKFKVHQRTPKLDEWLSKGGYELMRKWDELALFGRDVNVPLKKSFRGERVYGGYPAFSVPIKRLENRGFLIGYSESRKNPLWVSYRIFDVPRLHSEKRPSRFSVDERTRSKINHNDYTHSGYDRGHMAPNYGIATRYGRQAQKATFMMSNIIPQTPHVNRSIWKNLEHRVAKQYGRYFSEVWVITGPIFERHIVRLASGVCIPSGYYKILADEHKGRLRVLAFLVEKNCPPHTRIKTRLTSIDTIEKCTGLDFFPDLPAKTQAILESFPADRIWPWLYPALQYYISGKTY